MVSMVKTLILTASLLMLSGCSRHGMAQLTEQQSNSYREDILVRANNYPGLVDFYRAELAKKETPELSYKLAYSYYMIGNYTEALRYITPLLDKNVPQYHLLAAKTYVLSGSYGNAMHSAQKTIFLDPKNSEAYNIMGIANAYKGKVNESKEYIEKARANYIGDSTAVNNLAVLAMLSSDYQQSITLLFPEYMKGNRDTKLVHNLVFSLIKAGDRKYAKKIIEEEKIAKDADFLLNALSYVETLEI
ncbi:tetratricopeptide repeat protein [Aeromonas finlandensis]|uniref:tetratricopeptide repeat protein n=1 Tax=Aeromonas finlandensis TaxID=1543375 RepID=UPI00051C67D8|nr:hypothetical protein [Aeromonas finlandensis]